MHGTLSGSSSKTMDSGNIKRSTKDVQDDNVMGTNNSSIVSKRSVERQYYPEPHYFRYFVRKPQRRSPLINRGYWLRMQAVNNAVGAFLNQASLESKVVVNLGCGYALSDVLAFQWLAKHQDLRQGVLFVDVDHPKLMAQKIKVIQESHQLADIIGRVEDTSLQNGVFLHSKHYIALGCDLTQPNMLEEQMKRFVDLMESKLYFVAEVSITYMAASAADDLLGWASAHPNAQFCLLEQFLPDGVDHPFAKKMIDHFRKLRTPLQSVFMYPTLDDQRCRFLRLGWSAVRAQSLWQLWSDPEQVSVKHKDTLESAEVFDEWEEFILFSSHYFILEASSNKEHGTSSAMPPILWTQEKDASVVEYPKVDGHRFSITNLGLMDSTSRIAPRRFGTIFQSDPRIGFYGGCGSKSRLKSTETYSIGVKDTAELKNHGTNATTHDLALPSEATARTCHAMATFSDGSILLTGGRTAPDKPLKESWFFTRSWSRVADLPQPLFRHCMTWVPFDKGMHLESGVLVCGGKTLDNKVSGDWLFWQASTGWREVTVRGVSPGPIFGASLVARGNGHGVVVGGLTPSGTIQPDLWEWRLHWQEKQLYLVFDRCLLQNTKILACLPRLGAQLTVCEGRMFLIGGVANHVLCKEVECLELVPQPRPPPTWSAVPIDFSIEGDRPLFVGHSAIAVGDAVVVVGGGAVCFSFGSVWNQTLFSMQAVQSHSIVVRRVEHLDGSLNPATSPNEAKVDMKPPFEREDKMINQKPAFGSNNLISTSAMAGRYRSGPMPLADSKKSTVARQTVSTRLEFDSVIHNRRPILLSGVDCGPCQKNWTLQYLREKIGDQREVVVHQATGHHMNFLEKNFVYQRKTFGAFADEIAEGSRQYLRSVAKDAPASRAANIAIDFPELGADIKLPSQLQGVTETLHSSVLRIAGQVSIWLHYDVMANILIQISGTKRFVLYPPGDVGLFGLPPGASSSSVQVFEDGALETWPLLASSHPHEVDLQPGDVLFIPPLWLHAAMPGEKVGIAVNMFFRDLSSGYAAGRDVYGNRDVQAYERGRDEVRKMVRSFEHLPSDMARFYLERLADELKEESCKMSHLTGKPHR